MPDATPSTPPESLPVPWLAMTSRKDWLYNGNKPPSEEVWAQLEWDKAWVDLGPSPMGNPGPYWHVPLNDGEGTVQRLYPKLLKTKWLLIVRQAVEEYHRRESERAAQDTPDAGRSAEAPRYGNLPSVILSRLPVGEWRTEDARKQVAATGVQATPKQVFNALGYLTRRGRVRRLGYGRYQTVAPAISGGHDAG